MARNSSEAWTPALEKDGEEKPQGLFLILLIWEVRRGSGELWKIL